MKPSHVIKMFIGAMLIAALAACGNQAGNGTNKGGAASQAPSATASETEAPEASQSEPSTKVVETPFGKVEIPANPTRIVTDGYLPELLVLGVKPVGSTSWELENKVIQDQIDGIESTGERSLEAVLALEPDLIITWLSDENLIDQYKKIAPTIAIPYGYYSSIHETINYLGETLGKEEAGKQWLAELDETAANARAELADIIEPDATFALMGVFVVDRGFYVYGDGGYRGGEAIYTHLGLNPPPKQKEEMIGKEQYRQISYEVVDEYAGDYIFLDQGDMISEVWGGEEGVWKSLDAVQNDRVFLLDPDLFWGNDPVSLKLQIQEVVKMLKDRKSA